MTDDASQQTTYCCTLDDKKRMTLCHETRAENTEHVTLLLASPGIDVNKEDETGASPLHCVAYEGHSECVKLLLAAAGIDINKADKNGHTPLYRATQSANFKCAELIRTAGGK